MPLRFERVAAGADPARGLIAAMVAEMSALYEGDIENTPGVPSATAEDFTPPAGACLVGFDEADRAVCVGAIKDLGDGAAEVKRMYVVPPARGAGHGRVLLAALEDAAREFGFARTRLDTGARQPEVRALYERAGYRAIGDYNANPFAAWWAEKVL